MFWSVLVALFVLTGCDDMLESGGLNGGTIKLEKTEFEFSADGGSQSFRFLPKKDWKIEITEDWVTVTPAEGKMSADSLTVEIKVAKNEGEARSTALKFTAGTFNADLTVSQAAAKKDDGPAEPVEPLVVYSNDFDREAAVQGDAWPFLDKFDGWKNHSGSGAETVEYAFYAMEVHASDGSNKLFFGDAFVPYFTIKNIALGGETKFILTFDMEGTLKESETVPGTDVLFSVDNKNWIYGVDEPSYEKINDTRYVGSVAFSVQEGTESLSISFNDRTGLLIDNVKVIVSEDEAGLLDYSDAMEADLSAGSVSDVFEGEKEVKNVTVAEFEAEPINSMYLYRLEGTVGYFNPESGFFSIVDETGEVNVQKPLNWSNYKAKVAEGSSLVIVGARGHFFILAQVENASIESCDGETVAFEDAVAEEIIAAADGEFFRMTGYVSNMKNTTYGNYYLKDYSGEIYVYGTLNEAGESKKFAEMGINQGDIVTVTGPKTTYATTVELVDVMVENHIPVTEVSVSEFLNKEVSDDVYYRLTGIVSNLADGDQYGNFDITDESGSVYVYGLLSGWGGPKKAFQELGIKNGDRLTIVGVRGEYGGKIEVMNAFLVSIELPQITIAEALDEKAERVKIGGQVTATCRRGLVVTDETASVFVYTSSDETANYAVGDIVEVVGNPGIYNFGGQIGDPVLKKLESGTYTYPSPEVLDAASCDALIASLEGHDRMTERLVDVKYVSLEGTLSVSGSYYDIVIDGASTAQGAVYNAPASFGFADMDGERVTVTGYTVNVLNTKNINIIVTEVKK